MKGINFTTCSLESFDGILEFKFKGCQVQIMVLWLIHKLKTLSALHFSTFYFIGLEFGHL